MPAGLQEKVIRAQDQFVKRRQIAELVTFRSVVADLKKALTKQQIETAANILRAADKDGKRADRQADEKYFNAYVMRVVIEFPRFVELLNEVRMTRYPNTKRTR